MFAQCLHIFKLFNKDFKTVNLISISVAIGEPRYKTFDLAILKQYEISKKLNKI